MGYDPEIYCVENGDLKISTCRAETKTSMGKGLCIVMKYGEACVFGG